MMRGLDGDGEANEVLVWGLRPMGLMSMDGFCRGEQCGLTLPGWVMFA